MKKANPNQRTLFQSWSKQSTSHSAPTRQEAQNNTGFDPLNIIELGDDDEDDGLLAAAMEMEIVDENGLSQTTTCSTNNIPTSTNSFSPKEIELIPGFDLETGNVWIYPTNYPIRDYQFQIVEKALMMNTLVTLPTGLGKTFIAAVLMYNYYRWYPQGKIIFMAPTKPLVAQQIEACYNIMGIPESDTTELTGHMPPNKREALWKSKRVFFLTAQVLNNDLGRGSCDAEQVVLLVFDEAHKALGNHSYCQVIREIHSCTRNFRVLALSATPGDDIKAVQQVMSNLLISHMELRSEDSPDIQAYTHKRTVDKIVVPLGEDITRIKTQFLKVLEGIVGRLFCNRALWQKDPKNVTKFMLLTGRNKFREREAEGYTNGQKGAIEGDFAMAISLYHAYELLHQHGILSFYNFIKAIVDGSKGMARARTEIMRHTNFMDIMNELRELIEKPQDETPAETSALFSQFTSPRRRSMMREAFDPSFKSHPKLLKLEEVIVEHFQKFADDKDGGSTSATDSVKEVNTRVMIFSQYRDSVGEITAILDKHKPLVRVMSFIGQASNGKSSRGLSQKEQLEVVQRFRKGGYNTLVATCVGEEGLDIGDVDLIVCFDAHASPIRLVQRMGRTGRKRNGRIVVLVTEGKEEQVYKRSLSSKNSIHKAIKQGKKSFVFYDDNPRMIPRHLTPRVHKMEMTVGKYVGNAKKKRMSDTDCTKGNIKSLLSKSSTSRPSSSTRKDDAFLTDEEFDYWQKNFKLPNSELDSTSNKRRSANSSSDSVVKELSLSEWMPWQNVPSPVGTITHSRRTEHLIEILEFIELHNGEDDAYDVEMMSFLNEEDIPIVNNGSGNNTEEGPLIILDDEEDPIRVGKCKSKGKIENKKKKENGNDAENKNKKIGKNNAKVTSTKEKKKPKISKKSPPSRKWKDYLKALENEDNDFEPVEKSPVPNDNESFEVSRQPMASLGDDVREEQCRVDVKTNEKGGMKPLKNPDEEIDDDDSLLSSQQVSQLLPSVTPSNAFLFNSKIFDVKNSVRGVPTPPSLDSLNELSPYVCDVTGESFDKDRLNQPIRDKEPVCRRNIQRDSKMKCYKSTIIEEPPDDFEFNDGEMVNDDTSVKNSKNVIEDPPIAFEFDECEEDAIKYHESEEDIPEFQNNFKLEQAQGKDNTLANNLLDESSGLFDIDLNGILSDNENEKIELDDMMVTDKEVNKKQDAVPTTAGPIHIEHFRDDFNKSISNSIRRSIDGEVCTSNFSKPFKDCSEDGFSDDNMIHGFPEARVHVSKPGDAQQRSTKTNKESIGEEPISKPKKEWHKDYKLKISPKNVENNKTVSKNLTNLQSSLSKLSAFERNTKGLDCNGTEKKTESSKVSLNTISESTRMSPTSEKRQNEDFEFKKPGDFSFTRRPKSLGMNEMNEHIRKNHLAPESKLPSASTKLSLKKTSVSCCLEKGNQDPVGKMKPPIEVEKGQHHTRAILSDEHNILKEVSTLKDVYDESTLSICPPQEFSPKGADLNDKQNEKLRERTGIIHTVDEDSPVIRNRTKSKNGPAISSPVSPACSTPVNSRKANAVDEESPLIRRRSKVKTKNGDIVAIAESDEDDKVEDDPTEKPSVLNREGTRKAKPIGRDKKSKRTMILSDSEEEFENGNFRIGCKENTGVRLRNQKMRQQTSVKRKRQHCDIPSKKRKTHRLSDFLDEEAELSGSDIEEFSDVESEGSELDSFIDDSTQLTQDTPTQANPKKRKSKPDMLAVYRQSLFSPHARDLNFKTPTMCRNKNRYKMKYRVESNGESASEAEETYARESDLENELGSDSDCDLDESGDTLSVEDEEEENGGSKDSTPVASQVCRPLKRVKRKRILNESIGETESIVNTNTQSSFVLQSKHACPSKKSLFVTSSTLINHGPDVLLTSESTPLNMPSKLNRKSLVSGTNSSVGGSAIIQDDSFSTTFEFDWGLDFSDTDLLHAVQDEKKRVDDDTVMHAALKNATKKPDVCDNEMQEIAFAMAATDDDVNLEMSEMPTFSLGLDLFGSDSDDQTGEGKADTSENQNKNISSMSNPTHQVNYNAHFTKISPRSSETSNYVSSMSRSKANGNSAHVYKNNALSTAPYVNSDNHSTAKSIKNISLSRGHQTNLNSTFCRDQNMKSMGTCSASIVKLNNSLSSDQTIERDNNSSSDQSDKKIELSIQQNMLSSTRSLFPNKQHKTDNIVSSVVRPGAQDNKWSFSTTSSKGISHTRTNGLKDVTNMNAKPGGSGDSVKSIPTAFVSPSQKDKGKLVILADTKEISNSKIVPTLRRSHNIKVEVCQLQNCDYVVSNRMGVIRKLTSVVANSTNSTKILDKMRLLCDLYDRPCFIIEKDRVKPGETERDFSKSNAYVYTLACMAQTHIKVSFSQSQEETASLLTDLATLEAKKNTQIVAPIAMNKETQQVFRFLLTIPRVSYVTALNICSSLRTLRDIFSCSPEDLQKSMRQLNGSRAAEIHKYLRHKFTESMVNKNTRKST